MSDYIINTNNSIFCARTNKPIGLLHKTLGSQLHGLHPSVHMIETFIGHQQSRIFIRLKNHKNKSLIIVRTKKTSITNLLVWHTCIIINMKYPKSEILNMFNHALTIKSKLPIQYEKIKDMGFEILRI